MSEDWRAGRGYRPALVDLCLYAACLVFAAASAWQAEFYGYRVWGNFAVAAYVIAVAHAVWLLRGTEETSGWLRNRRSRLFLVLVVGLTGTAAPLAMLVVTRMNSQDWTDAPWAWSAQPDVWVIERSADLLLSHGTPYVDVTALGRLPVVNDYTPYGPVMSIFGLPRALLGVHAITDARIMFVLVAILVTIVSLRLLHWPRIPVRAAQLVVASPLTLLAMTTAGADLAVLALLGLAATLVIREKPAWAGVVAAVVASIKLIALPAIVVLVIFMVARLGKRAVPQYALTFVGLLAVLNLPVLLRAPDAFIEHAIRFPAGMASVQSPAGSPFPGHLLSELGDVGHAAALGLLAIGGLANLLWLGMRPPRTAADMWWRVVVGMTTAILLMPASRYGYFVYAVVFAGFMVFFRGVDRGRHRVESA